ncbi:MAG: 4-hydroxy-tetrahydrodipicolinate synthase [Bdellovibrionales bacterium]
MSEHSSLGLDGVITALVTPFYKGEVDDRSFKRLLFNQLNDGVDGVVVSGTTGESPTLRYNEIEKLFMMAKTEAGGKVPVLLGTGSNCTRHTIEMTQAAGRWGADAALVATPYYNKPPQRGLLAHFTAVAEASQIPIVLYDVPGRTITSIAVETVIALAKHPRIVGIKEASGDLKRLDQIKANVAADFTLLSGDDDTCVEFCRRGGQGVISVVSHLMVPELKEFLRRARGQDPKAEQDFKKYQALLRAIYAESNPIPIKAALYLKGLIDSMEMRLPLVALAEEHLTNLKDEMQKLGMIGAHT